MKFPTSNQQRDDEEDNDEKFMRLEVSSRSRDP